MAPNLLTDTGEDSKLVHRRKRPKVDTLFSWATSMTQRRVENTRVHFWTFLPVSVNKCLLSQKISKKNGRKGGSQLEVTQPPKSQAEFNSFDNTLFLA